MFEYNEIKILSHGLVFQISFFKKVNNVIYKLIRLIITQVFNLSCIHIPMK